MSKIITAPNPVLSQIAKPFVFGKDNLSSLLKEMEGLLISANDPKGVGLAAPQIGKSTAIFIAKPTEKSEISVFINPQIVENEQASQKLSGAKSASGGRVRKLEGCLSLPKIWGEVLRSPSVTLSYYDQKGKQKTKKFTGFMATIAQHEADHLNGILFPKRVLEQKGQLYKSYKNEKNEDEFEELTI